MKMKSGNDKLANKELTTTDSSFYLAFLPKLKLQSTPMEKSKEKISALNWINDLPHVDGTVKGSRGSDIYGLPLDCYGGLSYIIPRITADEQGYPLLDLIFFWQPFLSHSVHQPIFSRI